MDKYPPAVVQAARAHVRMALSQRWQLHHTMNKEALRRSMMGVGVFIRAWRPVCLVYSTRVWWARGRASHPADALDAR